MSLPRFRIWRPSFPWNGKCVIEEGAKPRNQWNATAKEAQSRDAGRSRKRARTTGFRVGHLIGTGNSDGGAVERGTKEAAGPLHPRSYYNRSSESLLKRVYTGLGVDSGRALPLPPFSPRTPAHAPSTSRSLVSANSGFWWLPPHTRTARTRALGSCVYGVMPI